MNKYRKKQQGFTLIEVLIVVAILGLLAALVGPRVIRNWETSKPKAAKSQISLFMQAMDLYRLDTGKYPTTDQGFQALRVRPQGINKWEGPYLPQEIPQDPWGNPYQYKAPGDHGPFDIISFGADGKPGGDSDDADIVSWKNIGQ